MSSCNIPTAPAGGFPAHTDMAALREYIGDRDLWLSLSGGKDSCATGLYLRELGLPFKTFFIDTGWESEKTYRYIEETLPAFFGEIVTVRADLPIKPEVADAVAEMEEMIGRVSPMVRLTLNGTFFPNRRHRTCTAFLKVYPAGLFFDQLEDAEPISVVGVRAEESARRAQMLEWETMRVKKYAEFEQWRPIITWTTAEVVDIHRRHGLNMNPLYRNAERVGCWPCIFARKPEIRAMADDDPKQIRIVKRLEELVNDRYRAKLAEDYAAAATDEERAAVPDPDDPMRLKTFFRHDGPTPIDDVVSWSRTSRGGRQMALLEQTGGCMRWGFCESGKPGPAEPDGS